MNRHPTSPTDCCIRRVRDPFGFLGNMSPHPVTWEGIEWRTSEALFQALRFPKDSEIRELIRAEKSPMSAKMVAKSYHGNLAVIPGSKEDLQNMVDVVKLKLRTHDDVRQVLLDTGERFIVEDCTKRQRGLGLFWGAALQGDHWVGENALGMIWMGLRERMGTPP